MFWICKCTPKCTGTFVAFVALLLGRRVETALVMRVAFELSFRELIARNCWIAEALVEHWTHWVTHALRGTSSHYRPHEGNERFQGLTYFLHELRPGKHNHQGMILGRKGGTWSSTVWNRNLCHSECREAKSYCTAGVSWSLLSDGGNHVKVKMRRCRCNWTI